MYHVCNILFLYVRQTATSEFLVVNITIVLISYTDLPGLRGNYLKYEVSRLHTAGYYKLNWMYT